jgi:hypothetical protein
MPENFRKSTFFINDTLKIVALCGISSLQSILIGLYPAGKKLAYMFKDLKGYIAPSVTALGDDFVTDLITTSGDVDIGVGDNVFPVD